MLRTVNFARRMTGGVELQARTAPTEPLPPIAAVPDIVAMSPNKALRIAILSVLEVSRFRLRLAPIFARPIGHGRLRHVNRGVRRILAQALGNFGDVGIRSRLLATQPGPDTNIRKIAESLCK